MISFIIFFIGIFALYKGNFRIFGRTVSRSQGRAIGLILMAPLFIEFCASALLIPNYVQFNADGTVGWDINALAATADQLSVIELITVFLAVGLALINIFSSPQGTAADAPQQQQPKPKSNANPFYQPTPPPPAPVPNIMTVAEAARYMRVSENEVLDLINGGKLAAARIGDSYRIARIAIEDFLNPTA